MLKKIVSITFILLANLVMIAHVLIPHHHHHVEEVCLDNLHCESDEVLCIPLETDCDYFQCVDHKHHGQQDHGACVLSVNLYRNAQQYQRTGKILTSNPNATILFTSVLAHKYASVSSSNFYIDDVTSFIYLESTYAFYSIDASALRGPPSNTTVA